LRIVRFFEANANVLARSPRTAAGLEGLRKDDKWRTNLIKNFPQGLKARLILRLLRHD
jgi:hypothetical protein